MLVGRLCYIDNVQEQQGGFLMKDERRQGGQYNRYKESPVRGGHQSDHQSPSPSSASSPMSPQSNNVQKQQPQVTKILHFPVKQQIKLAYKGFAGNV